MLHGTPALQALIIASSCADGAPFFGAPASSAMLDQKHSSRFVVQLVQASAAQTITRCPNKTQTNAAVSALILANGGWLRIGFHSRQAASSQPASSRQQSASQPVQRSSASHTLLRVLHAARRSLRRVGWCHTTAAACRCYLATLRLPATTAVAHVAARRTRY